jgi:hypothetical protein
MEDEVLARRRNRLLVVNATGFVIWQAGSFGPHLAGRPAAPLIIGIGLVGFVLWALSLALLWRPVGDARSRAALDDELTRHHWLQSMLAGYWVMLGVAAAGLAVTSLVAIPAVLVLRMLVVVGVAAPLLRFVVLERSVGGE